MFRDLRHNQHNIHQQIPYYLRHPIQQEEPGAVDWVSISPDYEYGHNTVDVFTNEMSNEVADFQMLDLTWPPFQSPTYSDYITQLTDDPAQGVFSTLFAGDMLNMLKQQKPFGFLDDKILATAGMDIDVLEPMSASGDLPQLWDALPYYAEAFDNPEMAERQIYRIGDGEAMSGILIAGRHRAGESVFLAFLMD